jgi:hypothetical protein
VALLLLVSAWKVAAGGNQPADPFASVEMLDWRAPSVSMR